MFYAAKIMGGWVGGDVEGLQLQNLNCEALHSGRYCSVRLIFLDQFPLLFVSISFMPQGKHLFLFSAVFADFFLRNPSLGNPLFRSLLYILLSFMKA